MKHVYCSTPLCGRVGIGLCNRGRNLNVYYIVCRKFSSMKIYRGCENGAKSSNSKPLVTDMTNSDPVAEVTESKSRGAAIGKKAEKGISDRPC